MLQVDLASTANQLSYEMWHGAWRWRAEVGVGGVGFAPLQKLRNCLDRQRHLGANGKTHVKDNTQRHGRHVKHGVIRQLFVGVRIDTQHRHRRNQQSSPVRRGRFQCRNGNLPARAGAGVNNRGLGIAAVELGGDTAGQRVYGSASRKAGQNFCGFDGLRPAYQRQAAGNASQGELQHVTARSFHGRSPVLF